MVEEIDFENRQNSGINRKILSSGARDGHVTRDARDQSVIPGSTLDALSIDTIRLSLRPFVTEQWPFELRAKL